MCLLYIRNRVTINIYSNILVGYIMNNYKLLSMDLDGTLLNSFSVISDKNKSAIKNLHEKGVKIVISTGRPKENIKEYMSELSIFKGYCQAFHGSTIFDIETMEIVKESKFDKKISDKILERISSYDDVGILVYSTDNLYTTKKNEYVNEYYQRTKLEIEIVENLLDIKEDISKILLKCDRKRLMEIKDEFSDFTPYARILFSELDLLEFMSLDTHKGAGLKTICDLYGIDIKDAVAVGDNYNDIEMIKMAGLGVSVNNAVDELKKASDYVLQSNNDEDAMCELINLFFNN